MWKTTPTEHINVPGPWDPAFPIMHQVELCINSPKDTYKNIYRTTVHSAPNWKRLGCSLAIKWTKRPPCEWKEHGTTTRVKNIINGQWCESSKTVLSPRWKGRLFIHKPAAGGPLPPLPFRPEFKGGRKESQFCRGNRRRECSL